MLTTYPTEVEGSLDAAGHSKRRTSPVMCATEFTGDGLLRHGSAIEIYPMFGPSPVLEPFWAAGFSFARGHFSLRVPYVSEANGTERKGKERKGKACRSSVVDRLISD